MEFRETNLGCTLSLKTAKISRAGSHIYRIRERQARLGPEAVRFAWVKAHIGTRAIEPPPQLAKEGAKLSEEWEGKGVERVSTVEAEVAEVARRRGGEEGEGVGDGKSTSTRT